MRGHNRVNNPVRGKGPDQQRVGAGSPPHPCARSPIQLCASDTLRWDFFPPHPFFLGFKGFLN